MQIKQLTNINPKQLLDLEACEKEVFGDSGLNRWILPVIARYGYLFVLATDGKTGGLASFINNKDTAFLVGFWVKESRRREGLGENLLKHAVAKIINDGVENIELTVQEDNLAALRLYQKVGFKTIKKITAFYGPNQPRLLLRYNLLK